MNAPRDGLAEELLTVLVVDDVENNLQLLSRLVSRAGHKVVLARSGPEAIECFKRSEPDLILMDIRMPAMDGFRTTAQIRALQGPRWIPVIYLTAHDADGGLVQAIDSGGDDYLAKPISAALLRAKLRAASRALSLQRENARQRAALERYFQAAEEEQKVASHLMQRLVQTDMLRDAAIEYRVTSASHLSGDVIAAARTPGNVLHVLLADGTGHGLAASLGVMPVVQPFYAMTEKGFGLSTIVREVNRKVREWLPVGRFVAATLLAIDAREGVVGVWNGGNPPVLLFGPAGQTPHQFLSRNLPLGILDDASLEDIVEHAPLPADAQIIACSDGVVEAQNPQGDGFGIDRLIAAASGAPRDKRMAAVNSALNRHLCGNPAHDDLSLVVADCVQRDEPDREERRSSGEPRADHIPNWNLRIELSSEDLRNTDVVARFTGTMERMGLPERHQANLYVILSELFENALEHGLLRLDRNVTSGQDGADRYFEARGKLLRMLTQGSVSVELEVDGRVDRRARVRVADSGDGFDWRKVCPSPVQAGERRGLQRVGELCSSVRFNEAGNDVVAIYPL